MNNQLDGQLFMRMCMGSHEALEKIYDRYFPYAVRLAAKITGDGSWAEDLAAGAFLRLWERRGSLEDVAAGRAYFLMTVRNMALTHLRDRGRHRVALGVDFEVWESDAGDTELRGLLVEGMKRLTPHERLILVLWGGGWTLKNIAQIRKTSVVAVHKVKERGIGKLRRYLG